MQRATAHTITDFTGALAAGLAISYWRWSEMAFLLPDFFTARNIQGMFINAGCFAVAAVSVLVWRGSRLARVGWLLIAVLGAAFCALVDEYVFRETGPDAVFEDLNMFPIGLALYSSISVPIMAAAYFSGTLLKPKLAADGASRYKLK